MSLRKHFQEFPLSLNEWVKNPTRIHEDAASIPGLTQWFRDPRLPQAVVSLIQPLAWELSYAVGAALKRKKNKEEEEERKHFQFQGWNKDCEDFHYCLNLFQVSAAS